MTFNRPLAAIVVALSGLVALSLIPAFLLGMIAGLLVFACRWGFAIGAVKIPTEIFQEPKSNARR